MRKGIENIDGETDIFSDIDPYLPKGRFGTGIASEWPKRTENDEIWNSRLFIFTFCAPFVRFVSKSKLDTLFPVFDFYILTRQEHLAPLGSLIILQLTQQTDWHPFHFRWTLNWFSDHYALVTENRICYSNNILIFYTFKVKPSIDHFARKAFKFYERIKKNILTAAFRRVNVRMNLSRRKNNMRRVDEPKNRFRMNSNMTVRAPPTQLQ